MESSHSSISFWLVALPKLGNSSSGVEAMEVWYFAVGQCFREKQNLFPNLFDPFRTFHTTVLVVLLHFCTS